MVWVVTAVNWLETLSYEVNSEQLEHIKFLLVNWNKWVGKLYIFNVISLKIVKCELEKKELWHSLTCIIGHGLGKWYTWVLCQTLI